MTANSRASWDYGRLAWMVIIAAFGLFCLLMVGACYGAWRIKAFAKGQPDKPAVLEPHVRGVEILRIGFEDLGRVAFDPLRHEHERGVFGLGRGERERRRRLAGAAPHIEHHWLN